MPKSTSYALWSLESYCLGMKLRALRSRKRLTLARLATETGLSPALLSKLETDRMVPTLPTLATICRVYGVGLSHFFSEPERHTLSITRRAHLQARSRGEEPVRSIPLNAPGRAVPLRAEMVEVSAPASLTLDGPDKAASAFLYVVEGRLQFNAGSMMEVLETGDCAYVDTSVPLAWSTMGKPRCRILMVRPGAASAS
jgi:transcriptional regulator with XRE-family HTH domain